MGSGNGSEIIERESERDDSKITRDSEVQRDSESNTTPPGWGLRCTPPRLFLALRGLPGVLMTNLHPQHPPTALWGPKNHHTPDPAPDSSPRSWTHDGTGIWITAITASKREFPRSFCSVGPPHMCWDPSATPQTPLPPVIWHYACDLCAFETKSHNRSEPLGGPE